MSTHSLHLSLDDHLARIVPPDAGKRSLILVKSDELRVVLLRMAVGADLREHSAPGLITIQGLSGRFTVVVGDERYELTSDGLLLIEKDVRHSVICEEDGAFLLTIAWPHGPDAVSSGEV